MIRLSLKLTRLFSELAETKIRQRLPRSQISTDAKTTECPECGKVFARKQAMVTHYRSKHEGIKYSCNQCDYQATQQGNLQKHIQSVHEGIKYPCNHCDYQATKQGNLQTHIAAKHSGNILVSSGSENYRYYTGKLCCCVWLLCDSEGYSVE